MKLFTITIAIACMMLASFTTLSMAAIDPDNAFVLINEFGFDKPISDEHFNDPNNVWSIYAFPGIIQEDTTSTFKALDGHFYVRIFFSSRKSFRMVFITRDMDIWNTLRQFSEGPGKEITLQQANSVRRDTTYTYTTFRYITDTPIIVPSSCAPDLSKPMEVAPLCGGECPKCMNGFSCEEDGDCGEYLTCYKPNQDDHVNPEPQQDGTDPREGSCYPTNAASTLSIVMTGVMMIISLIVINIV